MADFQKYDPATHPEVKLIDDYNSIVDHAFEKACSYIVRKKNSDFEAIYGTGSDKAGKILGSPDPDPTLAIQAIIDDMPTKGGIIYLPPEEMLLTKQFTSPVDTCLKIIDKQVTFFGSGYGWTSDLPAGTRLKLADDQKCTLLYYKSDLGTSKTGSISMYNLGIDGNRSNNVNFVPLIQLASDGRIRDSFIVNCGFRNSYGALLDLQAATDFWIYGNCFEDAYGGGVVISCQYQLFFFYNYIFNISYGNNNNYAVDISGGYLHQIAHNQIFSNYRNAMKINNLDRSNISNNNFYENSRQTTNTYDGLQIAGDSHRNHVHDNIFTYLSKQHKYDIHLLDTVDYIWVRNNICKAWGTEAIKTETGVNPNGVVEYNVT